jgi:hypothetical protein
VQLLVGSSKTVLSQSPWLTRGDVALAPALYARAGIARFGGGAHTDSPTSELLDFPPNLARIGGADSGWTVTGGGHWRWADPAKSVAVQEAIVDRSFAFQSGRLMGPGTVRARIRIHPGAGGAGIVTQATEDLSRGISCWLGGTFGAGCLMLYTHTTAGLQQVWAGKPDQWHYDEDRVVECGTRDGNARVRLFAADGTTLLDESPWFAVERATSEGQGYLALQTWLGTAEFAGFPGAGEAAGAEGPALASALGEGWAEAGSPSAKWTAEPGRSALEIGADKGLSAVLPPELAGTVGRWSCKVTLAAGGRAGLAIQTDPALAQGLLLLLDSAGSISLSELGVEGSPFWETQCDIVPGTTYTIEMTRLTDVVSVRVLDSEGKAVAERDRCYVPARYNALEGRLGLAVARGTVTFGEWALTE